MRAERPGPISSAVSGKGRSRGPEGQGSWGRGGHFPGPKVSDVAHIGA